MRFADSSESIRGHFKLGELLKSRIQDCLSGYAARKHLSPVSGQLCGMSRHIIAAGFFLNILVCTFAAGSEPNLVEKAQNGEAEAQFNLGVAFSEGNGVVKNSIEAVKWYQKSAAQGYAAAQYNLSWMYMNGVGVATNNAEAIRWLREAANGGLSKAQMALGGLLFIGEKIPKNDKEAVKWLRMAVEQGAVEAGSILAVIYASNSDLQDNAANAGKVFHLAADQGGAEAQYRLGAKYSSGDGVPLDKAEAVKWYRKAAEQGHAQAQSDLGWAYASGNGVAKDRVEAVIWFRKAAVQGEAFAQAGLGLAYFVGWGGLEQNSIEAVKWLASSSMQGNPFAQAALGSIYLDDLGTLKNEIEGLAWYYVAVASGGKAFERDLNKRIGQLGAVTVSSAQRRSKQIQDSVDASKSVSKTPAANKKITTDSLEFDTPVSSGSGAIVSNEGHVLTAAHVVAHSSRIEIITALGRKKATVLQIDKANDLAVLKLEAGIYPALPIVLSNSIRLGQAVATIGFPNVDIQGFSPKVTRGEISSINGVGDDPRSWQISVPVQTGNSGGPLLDENGSLVGVVISTLNVNDARLTGGLPQNVNYAVKGSYAHAMLKPLLSLAAPAQIQEGINLRFEDMIGKAQQSVVLILVYAENILHINATKGDARAQFDLGCAYFMGNGVTMNLDEAIKWFRKAADQGFAGGQFFLGLMYLHGQGVPKDSAEAVKWYRLAAGQGWAPAQHNLGVMYANGDGVPKDSAEAVKWYRKAAERGFAEAQFFVGVMYRKGDGVPKDSTEAVKWYRKAAEQGHAKAQIWLNMIDDSP